MIVNNSGLAFNKSVFRELKPNNKDAYKKATIALHKALLTLLLNNGMVQLLDMSEVLSGDSRTFKEKELTVAWPGLMTGLGYGHGAKTGAKDNDHPFATEVKTGFYFDFTTGLPVLPGSTVKGILRSFFPGRYKGNKGLRDAILNRIVTILGYTEGLPKGKDWDKNSVKKLEEAIFEGFEMVEENGRRVKRYFSSTEQDIFFDAFPCKGTTEARVFETNEAKPPKDTNGNPLEVFLGEDVLTPHRHPLRDPVPLKHLKILPGVRMKFQFLLNNKGGLTADEKSILFTFLLRQFGAGARKGTGFGQFEPKEKPKQLEGNGYIEFDDLDTKVWEDDFQEMDTPIKVEENNLQNTSPTFTPASNKWPDIKEVQLKKTELHAKVISIENQNLTVQPYIRGIAESKTIKVTLGRFDDKSYRLGDEIKIQLTQKQHNGYNYILQARILRN